jgi:hypothetical protein
VEKDLGTLYASGGGDGPEAVTAALAEALNMDWRPEASKMVVLIADAPPHGIGEYGDGASCYGIVGCALLTILQGSMRDLRTAMTHFRLHEQWLAKALY